MNFLTSNHFIVNDYLSFSAKISLCLISALFLLTVKLSYQDELISNNFEYITLIVISVLGLMLLCSANDLITAYLSIELHSIAFYLMATFNKNSTYSVESGLKYFVTGALSSAFFLFGSALIYGSLGSLSFNDFEILLSLSVSADWNHQLSLLKLLTQYFSIVEIGFLIGSIEITANLANPFEALETGSFFNIPSIGIQNLKIIYNNNIDASLDFIRQFLISNVHSSNNTSLLVSDIVNSFHSSTHPEILVAEINYLNYKLVYVGLLLVVTGVLIKLALAPFHFWSLDVYEGSPNSTTAFFAVVPKISLFVLLVRLYYSSFYNLLTFDYQNYFLLIALLSIFIGSIGGLEQRKIKTLFAYSSISHTGYLFMAFSVNSVTSLQLMLYYLVIFMVSGLCFWAIYLFIKPNQIAFSNKHSKELADFVLLKHSNPMLALALTITLFSIAGIPPLIGFIAKIGIFLSIIQSSAYLVATIGILLSVASTFYYIRFIKILYFENVLVGKLYHPITTNKSLLLALLTLALIVLSLKPTLIYLVFAKAGLLISF